MTFEDFKTAWDTSFEKWRAEDPDNHFQRVLHDVLGQWVDGTPAATTAAPAAKEKAGK